MPRRFPPRDRGVEDERPQEQAFGCHARAAAVGGHHRQRAGAGVQPVRGRLLRRGRRSDHRTARHSAVGLTLRTLFSDAVAAEIQSWQLKAVGQAIIDSSLCCNEVNKRFRRLVRMFAWGVDEGLVPSPVYWGLKAIKGVKKGRKGVRESEAI